MCSMEGNTPRATLPRHLGKLILARPSLKRMPCWVHEQCALWSADMYHSDAQSRPLLASLGAALRRGLGIACSACHRKGATVSCVYPLCKKVFHVGCAVSAHCHMDSAARWCTACPEHFSHAHHTLHTRMSQVRPPPVSSFNTAEFQHQCFCFQNSFKFCLGTLIQKIYVLIMRG